MVWRFGQDTYFDLFCANFVVQILIRGSKFWKNFETPLEGRTPAIFEKFRRKNLYTVVLVYIYLLRAYGMRALHRCKVVSSRWQI